MRNELVRKLNDWGIRDYLPETISTEELADYLIENGVVVPPCEVYKDVYLIVNGIIERCSVEGIYYTRKKNYVRLRPYHQEYLGNWSKYYTPSLRYFGKTVFLTREEAEQALKNNK